MIATSTAECTCQLHTCYSCRRQEIDAKALAIVERELQYGDEAHAWYVAERYRYPAINNLALEML